MDVLIYYPWLFVVFATIFGLIMGSFLNVVIHRLPIMMERGWREECAEAFPEYKITPPEGSTILACHAVLALSVRRQFAS